MNGKRFVQLVAVMLCAGWLWMTSTSTASTAASMCAAPAAGAPMLVTADCTDPRFERPVIDIDEWRNTPVRHRYVNGRFEGTDARFSFYFPPPEQYQRRFFQTTHQLLTSENTIMRSTERPSAWQRRPERSAIRERCSRRSVT